MSKTEKSDFPRDSRELEAIVGYEFKNKEWLKEALRHSSYVNEHKGKREMQSNDRLEFLGDSVLSVITSEYIFFEYPKNQEGDLTFIRRTVVDDSSSASFSAITTRAPSAVRRCVCSVSSRRSAAPASRRCIHTICAMRAISSGSRQPSKDKNISVPISSSSSSVGYCA